MTDISSTFVSLQICGIPIERTKTDSVLRQKLPEHAVMDYTAVRFVLDQDELERLRSDVDDIQVDAADYSNGEYEDYVVIVGDGKGCISVGQLRTMESFHEAIDCIHSAILAGEWLRRINVGQGLVIPEPLNEISDKFDEVSGGMDLLCADLKLTTSYSNRRSSRMRSWLLATCHLVLPAQRMT
jgi:hypothetical protein